MSDKSMVDRTPRIDVEVSGLAEKASGRCGQQVVRGRHWPLTEILPQPQLGLAAAVSFGFTDQMNVTLTSEISLTCAHQPAILRGDGTVFLPAFDSLLVADLHLGKAASFRAGGVPVPEGADDATLLMLSAAIEDSGVGHVFLLGDLVHNADSMTDSLIAKFAAWRSSHSSKKFTLIRGNHDRYVSAFPDSWQMDDLTSSTLGPFQLVHEVPTRSPSRMGGGQSSEDNDPLFQFGGHWHPVVSVGRSADRMRLPCFVVSDRHVTLPAFGPFKGGMQQERNRSITCYAICEGKIWST